MKSNLKQRFLEFVLKRQLFAPEEKVLVAVSGGLDSMVLLHLLLQWRRRLKVDLAVVHLNHGLRGEAAEADAEFVRRQAQELGVPVFLLHESVAEYARRQHLSVEEAGHHLRTRRFEQLAEEKDFDKIATAHHLDDQAETVLMRLLTGSGLPGLAGIRVQKGRWVRPLLFARRRELAQYAREQKIPFREDLSNWQANYLRNRIRHRILPRLEEEINPAASLHLARLAQIFQEWEEELDARVEEAWRQTKIRQIENKIHLEIQPFQVYFSGIKIKLLERILSTLSGEPFGITFQQLDDFLDWLQRGHPGRQFHWGGRLVCRRSGGEIVFWKTTGEVKIPVREIEPHRWYRIPESGWQLKVEPVEPEAVHFTADRREEFIDGSRLEFPLRLRPWKAGDRFVPLGMEHSRLVSDFLTDRKISAPARQQQLVLENKGEIVWLVGQQISEIYRVRTDSKKIWRLTIKEGYQGEKKANSR